jgi:hypothetical protein
MSEYFDMRLEEVMKKRTGSANRAGVRVSPVYEDTLDLLRQYPNGLTANTLRSRSGASWTVLCELERKGFIIHDHDKHLWRIMPIETPPVAAGGEPDLEKPDDSEESSSRPPPRSPQRTERSGRPI